MKLSIWKWNSTWTQERLMLYIPGTFIPHELFNSRNYPSRCELTTWFFSKTILTAEPVSKQQIFSIQDQVLSQTHPILLFPFHPLPPQLYQSFKTLSNSGWRSLHHSLIGLHWYEMKNTLIFWNKGSMADSISSDGLHKGANLSIDFLYTYIHNMWHFH